MYADWQAAYRQAPKGEAQINEHVIVDQILSALNLSATHYS